MNALLSIKPEFARKILSGEKSHEFRRTTFRDNTAVDTVYLYASSPVKEIVGAFTFDTVVSDSPKQLWEQFGDSSGISEEQRFMNYFEGTDTGYAIEIDQTHRFAPEVDPRGIVEDFVPPTSFYYLDGELLSALERRAELISSQGYNSSSRQYSTD